MNGVVKSFLSDKRYGFIRGEDGKDYFFHKEDVDRPTWDNIGLAWSDGDQRAVRVSFNPVKSPKGTRANSISLLTEG